MSGVIATRERQQLLQQTAAVLTEYYSPVLGALLIITSRSTAMRCMSVYIVSFIATGQRILSSTEEE